MDEKGNMKPEPLRNGAIHVISKLLKNVVALAAESEIGGSFENSREGLHMRRILIALKHPQPPTPIQTDNTTAQGIINNNAKQRKSRAMNMRYYWLRDRIKQVQFMIYWRPGTENYGDYFTKHQPAAHHRK